MSEFNKKPNNLFADLWQQYIEVTPSAKKIHQLLKQHGEGSIINDHIALRTCDLAGFGLDSLVGEFEKYGYKIQDHYEFKEKKLKAVYLDIDIDIDIDIDSHLHPHPYPKVFISELLLDKFEPMVKEVFGKSFAQLDLAKPLVTQGAPWDKDYQVYQQLSDLAEYASWLYAWGFRANHFTISINDLTLFTDLEQLTEFLIEHGFTMNKSGGLIKGSAQCYLAQSSTMADIVPVKFDNNIIHSVPSCFYEFAQRYKDKSGQYYQGFVVANADKIFESTFKNKNKNK